jgi:Cu2+-exporting ATPase
MIPGRMRFKIGRLKGSAGYAQEVQRRLDSVSWIRRASVNPGLGHVVVGYETDQIARDEFLQSLASILDVSPDELCDAVFGTLAVQPGEACSTVTVPAFDGQPSDGQPGQPEVQATVEAPASMDGLAGTSVVHTVPGRVRLRVPAFKTFPDLAVALKQFLGDQSGVVEVSVSERSRSMTVVYDPALWTSGRLCVWLQALNPAEVFSYQPAVQAAAPPAEISGYELWYSSAGIGLAFLVEPFAVFLSPALLLAAALPMLRRAHRSITADKKLNVDVLDASATSLLVLEANFPMALFMVWLINIADWIRDLTMMQSKKAIEEILGYQDIEAWVVRDGQKIRVSVAEIQLGETVVAYPGERIAVDGTVLEGKALVDQAMLTGESVPVEKEEGNPVFASTVVREGKLYVRADRIGSETEAAQILRLVEGAPMRETKIQNYAVKWANDLVPYSFAGGAFAAVMGGGLPGAAAVLIIDYGTGIRIAAPTTVLSAMTRAIRSGILIKGGRHLENLAEVDAMVFDKTGTLTIGQPDVLDVTPFGSTTAAEVLTLAAAAELRWTHPVATAVVRAAEDRGLTIPERSASDYTIGLGVEAVVNESVILVGSPRFLMQRGLQLMPEVEQRIEALQGQAVSPLCVARDGTVIGVLGISDPLRPEAKDVIVALRDRGVKRIIMLTGDHRDVAKRVAGQLGITEYVAEIFPGDKSDLVQRLQQEGHKVAVAGDGINDSPMLAYADVGIAVEGGTEAARETAPVVLLHGGLWKVPLAIDICRETVALIKQNWKIISIPNTIALGLATVALLGPIAATLLSNGCAIIATMNGLRPLMAKPDGAATAAAHRAREHERPQLPPFPEEIAA